MPWSHTSPMDQRTQFIADCLRESLSITELCELYREKEMGSLLDVAPPFPLAPRSWLAHFAGIPERPLPPHRSRQRPADDLS